MGGGTGTPSTHRHGPSEGVIQPAGGLQEPSPADRSDAADVEQHACPGCDAQPGSPCRSRGGAIASACHARRSTKVPRLKKALRVPASAGRGPGRSWHPRNLAVGTRRPGSTRRSAPRIRVRPRFEEALRTVREVRGSERMSAPHCRGVFTMYEMRRFGRDAAELTAPTHHLTAHGPLLEMLPGPLPGPPSPSMCRALAGHANARHIPKPSSRPTPTAPWLRRRGPWEQF